MLSTDWGKPGTSVLGRLSDPRVHQFWDHDHLVASAVRKAAATGKLHPDCCQRHDVLWDLIAAYAPGALWRELLPQPSVLNGTVVHTAPELDALIASTAGLWPASEVGPRGSRAGE